MKPTLPILLFLTLFSNTIYGQKTKPLLEIDSFGNNPGNLKMFLHQNTTDTSKMPLVVVLHGCSENAAGASELTGWNKLADINDFVVLYPQQKIPNNPNLCFNWFNLQDINKGKGECESIYQMIMYARQHYRIDSNRIYITGLSAGGAMSVVMAATHPELFKGGAVFAGGAYKIVSNPIDGLKAMQGKKYIPREKLVQSVREQNPNYKGQYPPLIVYQGKNDPIVDPKSTSLLINQWTGINKCDTIPDKVERAFVGIEDICRTEYSDSAGRKTLVLYEVNNLRHQLLVKPGANENEGGKTGLFGIDKGFHSTYHTAKAFGIIKKD